MLPNIQVDPKVPKPRDDRHASQLNVLAPIPHPALLCISKPWAKDFLAPWETSLCPETDWLLYPSFMLEINDSAVTWGFLCLPSTWYGRKHRQILQEAGLAVCVWTAATSREESMSMDNLKSPGRWWASHFGEFPFGLFLNNLWSCTSD